MRAFSLARKDHLELYEALSADRLTAAPFWQSYREGVKTRNEWVHGSTHVVSTEAAEKFLVAVLDLFAHVEGVLQQAGVESADDRMEIEWFEREDMFEARLSTRHGHADTISFFLQLPSEGDAQSSPAE